MTNPTAVAVRSNHSKEVADGDEVKPTAAAVGHPRLCKCGGSMWRFGEKAWSGNTQIIFHCSKCGRGTSATKPLLTDAERFAEAGLRVTLKFADLGDRLSAKRNMREVRKWRESTWLWISERRRAKNDAERALVAEQSRAA